MCLDTQELLSKESLLIQLLTGLVDTCQANRATTTVLEIPERLVYRLVTQTGIYSVTTT